VQTHSHGKLVDAQHGLAPARAPFAHDGHAQARNNGRQRGIGHAQTFAGHQVVRKNQQAQAPDDGTEHHITDSGQPGLGFFAKGFGQRMQAKLEEHFAQDLQHKLAQKAEQKFKK
jgi:hypothetical protein